MAGTVLKLVIRKVTFSSHPGFHGNGLVWSNLIQSVDVIVVGRMNSG